MVTTQGLMEVAKFLAVKGPRGTYSHFCTSRALQSFISTSPKSRASASAIVSGRPVDRWARARVTQGEWNGRRRRTRTKTYTCTIPNYVTSARTKGVGRPADEGAYLQLEVQQAAGPVHRALLLLVTSFDSFTRK